MSNFFEFIYGWFQSFFGLDLSMYLSNENLWLGIGCLMIGISLFVVLLYYKILDLPALSKIWCWGLFLVGNFVVNLFVGWAWVWTERENFVSGDDETGQQMLDISQGNLWGFGASSAILSLLFFILFTLLLKWWSTNCKRCPF